MIQSTADLDKRSGEAAASRGTTAPCSRAAVGDGVKKKSSTFDSRSSFQPLFHGPAGRAYILEDVRKGAGRYILY